MEVDPEFDDQDEGIKSDTDSPIAEAVSVIAATIAGATHF